MLKTDLKTKRLYEITTRSPFDDSIVKRDAQGYRVVILGLEEFSFFVHRRIEPVGSDSWRISEVTTGFALPSDLDGSTRQEAIDNATTFLSEKGKPKFITAMDRAKNLLRGDE